MDKSNNQAVVIGAGMGGLSSALLLANAGWDVTVIEAADGPGGKMRTLPSKAGPVDAGPTVLTLRPVFEALFAAANSQLSTHVSLVAEPILARHFWRDGSQLDLFADHQRSMEAIKTWGGLSVAREYDRFHRIAGELFDAFDAPMMRHARPSPLGLAFRVLTQPRLITKLSPHRSLAQVLQNEISDPRLGQLLGRYATYVGGRPDAVPALLRLIFNAESSGIWRVVGGMNALARAICTLAKERGASFLFNTQAREIITKDGKVCAVDTSEGPIATNTVVFNGDPRALSTGLLGKPLRKSVSNNSVNPRSLSAAVYAFAATPRGVDLAHHNIFFGEDPKAEFGPLADGEMPNDPTLYVCAQDRGNGVVPPALERFEIIMNAPPLPGASLEEPAQCQTRIIPTLNKMGLEFDPQPAIETLTMPTGFNQLFPGSLGSLYGRSPQGMMAAFARPKARTRIAGLFLAGGGCHPGAGIPMATLSGMHAAATIMKRPISTWMSPKTDTPGGISTG